MIQRKNHALSLASRKLVQIDHLGSSATPQFSSISSIARRRGEPPRTAPAERMLRTAGFTPPQPASTHPLPPARRAAFPSSATARAATAGYRSGSQRCAAQGWRRSSACSYQQRRVVPARIRKLPSAVALYLYDMILKTAVYLERNVCLKETGACGGG